MEQQHDTSYRSQQLVDHFFRHESANLIAILTRTFGLRRLDLVEDKVQEAMVKAVTAWRQRGVPQNPAAWMYRVSRNGILDALRREKVHAKAVVLSGATEATSEGLDEQWIEDDPLSDSLLRMMFVCCHPALDRASQIAMTLKILCGFSVQEVARGLLIQPETAKKRIQRAKKKLQDLDVRLELPSPQELDDRLAVIHDVLYVMFNEGYSSTSGNEPLKDDVCEEAARLCHLLAEHRVLSTPTTRSLLALMLFHASRLGSRVDASGAAVLLQDQDRSQWDRGLMQVAQTWLGRSRKGPVSRFHLEAVIALVHCHAKSTEETDWHYVVRLYDQLVSNWPSPIYVLNRAIARGMAGDPLKGLEELEAIRGEPELRVYHRLDCAAARLHELANDPTQAMKSYRQALRSGVAPHERTLIEHQLEKLATAESTTEERVH